MKIISYTILAAGLAATACSNEIATDSGAIKAYPNPYNAAAGVLTIEKTDGSIFSQNATNEIIVYDFNMTEVYHANAIPDATTAKKLIWGGIDKTGTKVAAGMYYLKVIISNAAGVSNADSMYKLAVQ